MKNNIKVGDYARNKYGIGKILEVNEHGKLIELIFDRFTMPIVNINGEVVGQMSNKFIINTDYEPEDFKFSSNIIDLIEVGDIIRYTEDGIVADVRGKTGEKYINTFEDDFIGKENIYSIITKEQMETMEYKIERL